MNKSRVRIIIIGCLLFLINHIIVFSQIPVQHLLKIIQNNANELLKDERFHAVSIAIHHKGIDHISHYGSLDKKRNNKPTNETLYEIASVTKTMTGFLVAKAIKDSILDLDAPVMNYLGKSYENLAFNGIPITIKHLLTHTSGIPLNIDGIDHLYQNSSTKSYHKAQEILQNYSKEELLSNLEKVQLKSPPGVYYSYSNITPNILAHILELVYNKPFEKILQSNLFDPIGMNNTGINLSKLHQDLLANGYNDRRELMPNFKQHIQLWGAAGRIKSNAPDLLNYIKLQLNENNPTIKESHRKLFQDLDKLWIGYYWEIIEDQHGKHLEHHGGIYGSQNWILIYPKDQFGISIITNTSFPEANTLLKQTAINIFEEIIVNN